MCDVVRRVTSRGRHRSTASTNLTWYPDRGTQTAAVAVGALFGEGAGHRRTRRRRPRRALTPRGRLVGWCARESLGLDSGQDRWCGVHGGRVASGDGRCRLVALRKHHDRGDEHPGPEREDVEVSDIEE